MDNLTFAWAKCQRPKEKISRFLQTVFGKAYAKLIFRERYWENGGSYLQNMSRGEFWSYNTMLSAAKQHMCALWKGLRSALETLRHLSFVSGVQMVLKTLRIWPIKLELFQFVWYIKWLNIRKTCVKKTYFLIYRYKNKSLKTLKINVIGLKRLFAQKNVLPW